MWISGGLKLSELFCELKRLCKFEKFKEWKTGFSVKCPKSTATCYIVKKKRSAMLHYWIEAKRSSTCAKCDKKEIEK